MDVFEQSQLAYLSKLVEGSSVELWEKVVNNLANEASTIDQTQRIVLQNLIQSVKRAQTREIEYGI